MRKTRFLVLSTFRDKYSIYLKLKSFFFSLTRQKIWNVKIKILQMTFLKRFVQKAWEMMSFILNLIYNHNNFFFFVI